MKLYVGNIARQASDADIRTAFEAFGAVTSAKILTDRETGESRGFGFVEMPTDAEAKAAIAGLNGKEHMGRPLTVNEARPRTEGGGGGGGGFRGPGGGGGGRREGRGGGGGGRGGFRGR